MQTCSFILFCFELILHNRQPSAGENLTVVMHVDQTICLYTDYLDSLARLGQRELFSYGWLWCFFLFKTFFQTSQTEMWGFLKAGQ